jgi:crotonobetainyl-CoA:carnitine CoA-transferase CaiB-like acyl-CoA transferase
VSTRPLEGITVVSIEQAVAAPFATRQLADLGARVIKVERPDGGDFARHYDEHVRGLASYFVWLNRSKESLALDLKSEAAPVVLEALLERADVFVQNLAPGATTRLGLGVDELRNRYPRLIVCDLSGYGSSGPYVDKKAYDLLVQCETGVLSVTGTPDEMVKTGISVADLAGGMYAYSSILSALFHRERTGEALSIEVSLFDALTEWMSHPIYATMYTGQQPPRSGSTHANVAPYGPFRAADGVVLLGIQNEREWARFCADVLVQPELATDERFITNPLRADHRAELTEMIEEVFAGLSSEQVIELLDAAQIANARQNDVAGLISHPQLTERNRWSEVHTPVGPVAALRPPAILNGLAGEVDDRFDPVPALGEHTEAILTELGLA